ncbi:hypothetical protein AWM68_09980 [Fictibacillus phosphorivorans]|uniref:Uncharacterized protein n=1 Tax=Fictibacillus phosphorivorans TaxID=1221500 RepID=A0A163Q2C8_9BACL|nr:hypothetical protein [Fictibacillus phosphorivorans]KZE64469.1 hypothetical protein AWM68_09980 [Fictibacillus phosphorivorans]
MARKYFRKARFPAGWFVTLKQTIGQLTAPLIIFQLLRTILFPSAVDFIILLTLVILHICFAYDVL